MFVDFGVGRERPQRYPITGNVNAAQLIEWPDVYVFPVGKLAGFEQYHQVSAAGERFPVAVFLREEIQSLVKTIWRQQFVGWNVASHRVTCRTLAQPIRRFSYSLCSGTDYRLNHFGSPPQKVWDFSPADSPPP